MWNIIGVLRILFEIVNGLFLKFNQLFIDLLDILTQSSKLKWYAKNNWKVF